MRSAVDSAYDLLGWIRPFNGVSTGGMKFSTPDVDNDIVGSNCAAWLGGGFWHNKCGIFITTIKNPSWFSRGQSGWQAMTTVRKMVKLQ